MESTQQLAERYAAAWNEADESKRRAAIAALWSEQGTHYVRDIEARGYAALEQRIKGSHDKNVRDNGNIFRARQDARRLRDVVTFTWEMRPEGSDEVLAVGLEFLHLDAAGRITADYQFILS